VRTPRGTRLAKNQQLRSTLNLQAFLAPPRHLSSMRMSRGRGRMHASGPVF